MCELSLPPSFTRWFFGEKKKSPFEAGQELARRNTFLLPKINLMILLLILFCLHGPQTSYRKPLVTSRKQTGHRLHAVWVMAGGRKKGGNGETFMQNLEHVLPGMFEVGPCLRLDHLWAKSPSPHFPVEGCSLTHPRHPRSRLWPPLPSRAFLKALPWWASLSLVLTSISAFWEGPIPAGFGGAEQPQCSVTVVSGNYQDVGQTSWSPVHSACRSILFGMPSSYKIMYI